MTAANPETWEVQVTIPERIQILDDQIDQLRNTYTTAKDRAKTGVEIHGQLSQVRFDIDTKTEGAEQEEYWELFRPVADKLLKDIFGIEAI